MTDYTENERLLAARLFENYAGVSAVEDGWEKSFQHFVDTVLIPARAFAEAHGYGHKESILKISGPSSWYDKDNEDVETKQAEIDPRHYDFEDRRLREVALSLSTKYGHFAVNGIVGQAKEYYEFLKGGTTS